jgi:hypothetical protein
MPDLTRPRRGSVTGHGTQQTQDWLSQTIDFDLMPGNEPEPNKVPVDLAPFQVPELTSMPLLHFLFAVCMYSRIYVTHHGKLMGIAYKNDFLDEKWVNK